MDQSISIILRLLLAALFTCRVMGEEVQVPDIVEVPAAGVDVEKNAAPAQDPAKPGSPDEATTRQQTIQRMVEETPLAEVLALLGNKEFRVRELAGKRLQKLLEAGDPVALDLCYQAYTNELEPEIRMRARALLLDYVTRSRSTGERGFVGVGLLLHAYFDKEGKLQFAVKVTEVVNGTPAQLAGIKIGDLIVAVDDASVATKEGDQQFMDIVSNKGAGKKVTIKYLRNGENKTVELVLAARPAALQPETNAVDPEQLFREFLKQRTISATK